MPAVVVGIGASAGSVEAFTQMLTALRPDTGAAFVLLSHLSPTHRSELSRLFAPLTRMSVHDAVDGESVEPNHVYVLPANRSLTIAEGRLHLADRDEATTHPTAIDQFFQSLAVDLGSKAVGVILSGTGSDGTAGLTAIKARGGTTYAEDPVLAAYDGMPRSAVRAGVVDFVLPIGEIAGALGKLDGMSRPPSEPEETPPTDAAPDDGTGEPMPAHSAVEGEALEAIIRILQTATGVDFHHYKRPSLARRIRHRVDEVRLGDFVSYLARLRSDPDEVSALFDTVLIQVTGFFREPATFGVLQSTVIPPLLIGRSAGTPLRAWVVGCATGQEAYSLAMSFLEVEAGLGLDALVRVFASDLSESGLARSRAGQYSRDDTTGLSPERLQQFFVPVDHGFQVNKRLRGMCVFARHDITRDPPFAQLDLVLCCNVLIYLDQVLQRRVLQNIHYALKPSGYLVLGPAETTAGVDGLFSPLDRKQKIFLRRHAPSRPHVSLDKTGVEHAPPVKPASPLRSVPLQWSTAELQRAAERVLFAQYATASVIVNSELEVLHFQGRTTPYLEAPTGGPTAQLLRLAHPDLRLILGRLLRRAKKDQGLVRRRGVRFKVGDTAGRVTMSVLPVFLDATVGEYYLVVFDRTPRQSESGESADGGVATVSAGGETSRVLELETDLAENKEYLQAIIDQQDATHAELQAAYEASLSVNEEYQSTNEELESTKEEMQSLNEEMTTVNEQLQQRHAELQARNAEVSSLLESTDMAMLLLTRDLRLRAFNSRAAVDLRLVQGHVGRGIPETHLPLSLPELGVLTERAIGDNELQERELQDHLGRWRALRVWPVQPGGDGGGTVAVALVDIAKLKGDVAQAAAAQAYSEAIVETVMEPLVVLDDDLRILHANPAFHQAFQTDAHVVAGKRLADLGEGEWAGGELDDFLHRTLGSNRPVRGPEITLDSTRFGRRTFQLSAGFIGQRDSGPGRLLLAMEDLSARKLAEATAIEASRMQVVGELAGGVAHEINNQMTVVLGYTDFLLRQMADSDPMRTDVARIVKAARRSAEVTGQLLAFSRRQRLEPVVLDLNTFVAASETLLRRMVGPDIEIEIMLGDGVGRVRADQAQLEQVLVNLSLNARDAMQGSGRLILETTAIHVADPVAPSPNTAAVPRGMYARLTVRDTGAGMDPSTQARIFEPFFTTKPPGSGTGLGLASVYGMVRQSGGSVWVESELGRGTTFTIDLPQVLVEAPVKPAAPTRNSVGGSETILVVEDEEAVRVWVSRCLREMGYTVVEAGDAASALRMVAEAPAIDLVVSDVVMPGLDAAKLRARLVEARPELPVVLMSGFAREELIRQGRLDAGTTLMHKPFDPAALAVEVRQALDGARGAARPRKSS
ncbi:MAG: chemotaxis protein CheB [Gemmatimonadales bacterium]